MQEVAHQILRESESERARERARPLHPRCKKATKRPHAKLLCPLCVCRSLSVSLPPPQPRRRLWSLRLPPPLRLPAAAPSCSHDCGLCGSVAPHKITENVRNGAADYVVVLFLFFVHQRAQRLTSTTRELACANLDVTRHLIRLV